MSYKNSYRKDDDSLEKSFSADDVKAFIPVFNKVVRSHPGTVLRMYSNLILGQIVPAGIMTYVFKEIATSKKVCFELEAVFFDETEKTYIGTGRKDYVLMPQLLRRLDEACIKFEKADEKHIDSAEALVEKLDAEISEIRLKLDEVSEDAAERGFVGYDIEYQFVEPNDIDDEPTAYLLSHQFYVAHNGIRYGVILQTDRRFTETAFAKLVASIVPETVKKCYVVAHYSIVEGGWMLLDQAALKGRRKQQYRSVLQVIDESKDPRIAAVVSIEDEIIKRIINEVFAEMIRKDPTRALSLSKDLSVEITADHAKLNSFAIKALLEFKTPERAYNAVRGGYAKYPRSLADDEVPAIRISEKLAERYRDGVRQTTVFKKYKKTWAGTYRALSHNRLDNLTTHIAARRNEWIQEFSEREEYSLDETVLLSVLSRNAAQNLNDSSEADALWSLAADTRTGRKSEERKKYEEKCLKAVERNAPVTIEFCDMMHFSTDEGKSLKAFGNLIGIQKLDLSEDTYVEMDEFLKDNSELFYRYGIRDSVIAAEALAYFGWLFLFELDAPFATRITGYSRNVFREVLSGSEKRYEKGVYEELMKNAKHGTPEKNIKNYLGFSRKKKRDGSGNFWWPSVSMQMYSQFYYGGWNDCRVVGAYDSCTYWDLKSAYPSAIAMLEFDANYSKAIVFRGEEAQRKADELFDDGEGSPFQIAGVEISFEFLPGKEPIFPVRFDRTRIPNLSLIEFSEQLLYTQRGHTSVGWPEYFVARRYGLLDEKKTSIKKLVTYERISDSSIFAKEIERLLRMRGEPGKKMLFKETLNFLYGQTAMGVDRKITLDSRGVSESKTKPGGLTCIPMAAYCTSFCRAVMGELLACGNEAYAITTDGFISPQNKELKRGVLAEKTNDKLKSLTRISDGKPLNYEFIEPDFRADRALFLKTRGYLLEGRKDGEDPSVHRVKMAKMGVQTQTISGDDDDIPYDPSAREFLIHLKNGVYDKKSWSSFSELKRKNRNDLPLPVTREARLSHTYDFKRIIDGDVSEATFSYAGVHFAHPKFKTAPLPDVDAFVALRSEMERNATVADYMEMLAAVKAGGYVY